MATDTDTSTPAEESSAAPDSTTRFWQRWQVRSLLFISFVLFGLVVAVDSFQAAIAADFSPPTPRPALSSQVIPADSQPATSRAADASFGDKTYLEFDPQRANRLGRSDLLGANLTRSRLTDAHLFTTLVR